MAVINLGLVQAIWVSTVAPTNTSMIWYDINSGVRLHKYYDTDTSTWVSFVLNAATLPLLRTGGTISINYDPAQFEVVAGNLTIKANVLSAVTPPFPISDITGLQTALDLKVDKVTGKSLILDSEILRLSTVVNYTHPVNHPPAIITQDLNNRFVTDIQIAAWSAKQDALGFTPYNATNPAGYITEDYFLTHSFAKSYRIILPSAGSVAARVLGATEGVDYPTGWVLHEAGDNANDLMIDHNLDKSMMAVTVSQISVLGERRLVGNAAYAGLLEPDSNSLRIEGLATVAFQIAINIIFY